MDAPKTGQDKALELIKNGHTIAKACREVGLKSDTHVRKFIYKHGGMEQWRKKGCPICAS